MKKISNILTLLSVTFLLAGCVIGEDSKQNSLPVGASMPEFSVVDVDNEPFAYESLAGKRALVVFFRSTCGDCKRELPLVETAYRAVKDQEDFRLVAITKEANAATVVADYWGEQGYTMPWYIDDGMAFTGFEVERVPTLYLFGTDGKVAFVAVETFKNYGINTADDIVELINELR